MRFLKFWFTGLIIFQKCPTVFFLVGIIFLIVKINFPVHAETLNASLMGQNHHLIVKQKSINRKNESLFLGYAYQHSNPILQQDPILAPLAQQGLILDHYFFKKHPIDHKSSLVLEIRQGKLTDIGFSVQDANGYWHNGLLLTWLHPYLVGNTLFFPWAKLMQSLQTNVHFSWVKIKINLNAHSKKMGLANVYLTDNPEPMQGFVDNPFHIVQVHCSQQWIGLVQKEPLKKYLFSKGQQKIYQSGKPLTWEIQSLFTPYWQTVMVSTQFIYPGDVFSLGRTSVPESLTVKLWYKNKGHWQIEDLSQQWPMFIVHQEQIQDQYWKGGILVFSVSKQTTPLYFSCSH